MAYVIEKDDIKCHICLDPWLSKNPRVLTCQHVYCLACIGKLEKNGEIVCSVCNKLVEVPDGGVSEFPKCFLGESIKQIEKQTCVRHKKPLIQPGIFCKFCNIQVECTNCLSMFHSNENCRLIPLEEKENLYETLKVKLKSRKEEDKKIMNKLLEQIKAYERNAVHNLQTKFKEMKDKLTDYYEKRSNVLDECSSRLNSNINLNIIHLESELTKFSNEYLTIKSNPQILIDISLELDGDIKLKDLVEKNEKINLTKLNEYEYSTAKFKFLAMNNFGIFYSENYPNATDEIVYETFETKTRTRISLDENIHDFLVTKNFIFCLLKNSLDEKFGLLAYSDLNNSYRLKLKPISDDVVDILNVFEDAEGERYILIWNVDNELELILNDSSLWQKKMKNKPISSCLNENGIPMLLTSPNEITILSKEYGTEARSFPLPTMPNLKLFNDNRFFSLQTKCDTENEKILYLFNEANQPSEIYRGNIDGCFISNNSNHIMIKEKSTKKFILFVYE